MEGDGVFDKQCEILSCCQKWRTCGGRQREEQMVNVIKPYSDLTSYVLFRFDNIYTGNSKGVFRVGSNSCFKACSGLPV